MTIDNRRCNKHDSVKVLKAEPTIIPADKEDGE